MTHESRATGAVYAGASPAADHSGNAAISLPAVSPLQRMTTKGNEDNDSQTDDTHAATVGPFQLKPNHTGLPDHLKSGIENLSGYSMDDVNVQYNSAQPAQLNALAYAQGNQIHIGPGQEKHLAHEAWHVVQQKQGRVSPTRQLKGTTHINDNADLEKEADVMGLKATQATTTPPALLKAAPSSGSGVLQPMMGFELELLVLVDINGRPAPEKSFLGSYGAQGLELQVDHNGTVAGPTPTSPADANFQVATNLHAPVNWRTLGAYDLPATHETRVGNTPGVPPVADPRTALPRNSLTGWQHDSADAWYSRVPATNTIGMNNSMLTRIDQAIPAYLRASENWEANVAMSELMKIKMAIADWMSLNEAPSLRHPINLLGYHAINRTLNNLKQQVQQHYTFWIAANQQPPAGLSRLYRRAAAGAHPATAWSAHHPIAGQGNTQYASILEIVTRPYAPETAAGRNDLIAAMTEAATLATDIQNGTANFANRIPLNTIAHTNVLNPQIHVGNPLQPLQSTDASIQSTFAIDLAQIPSLVKSTVAFGAPQNQLSLKHQADIGGTAQNPGGTNRAELEMSLAVRDATNVINDLKAQIAVGAPSFVNLRGLLTLVCQYLRLGKYWTGAGITPLDKNLTDLLSRTDLSHIFLHAVPATEKAWLQAAPANMNYLYTRIFARTGRVAGSVLMNNPNENEAAGPRHFGLSCNTFVQNVFTQATDGITARFGGFQQRPAEGIDPTNARHADTRRAGATEREAPVFEMRNMIPKGGAERFPVASWVPMTQYMIELIRLLNARTEAQATQDVKVHEHLGGAANPPGLGNPEQAW